MDLFIFAFQMPDCHDDSPRLNNETLCRIHDVLNKAIATGASLQATGTLKQRSFHNKWNAFLLEAQATDGISTIVFNFHS